MAFTTSSQPRSIIILELAIFLTVFLINESVTAKFTAHFITKPKKKEIFVGDSVQFDWDYKDEDSQVKTVAFGQSNDAVGSVLRNYLKKQPGQDFVTYTYRPAQERGITAVQGKRASFSIRNVKLNDTGYYFCFLYPKSLTTVGTRDIVFMKVVDLQIDEKQSDDVVESWPDQQISLACSVRVTDNTQVEFSWQQKPSNRTMSRGKHVDANKESILKLITSSDDKFSTYTCIAKTTKTIKEHNIFVKRLYGPGPPENLQSQLTFNKAKGESYYKLSWTKPKSNGGAQITGYIIEYKPEGISWDKATRARSTQLEHTMMSLKEGKTYDIRVRALNKVNEGDPSNEIQIKLDPYSPNKEASSNSSNGIKTPQWLHLMTIALAVLIKSMVLSE